MKAKKIVKSLAKKSSTAESELGSILHSRPTRGNEFSTTGRVGRYSDGSSYLSTFYLQQPRCEGYRIYTSDTVGTFGEQFRTRESWLSKTVGASFHWCAEKCDLSIVVSVQGKASTLMIVPENLIIFLSIICSFRTRLRAYYHARLFRKLDQGQILIWPIIILGWLVSIIASTTIPPVALRWSRSVSVIRYTLIRYRWWAM